jgi:hypothetical protein
MLKRGRQSALGSARNDAAQALRDAAVHAQGADWAALPAIADDAVQAAERLRTLAGMWETLDNN